MMRKADQSASISEESLVSPVSVCMHEPHEISSKLVT